MLPASSSFAIMPHLQAQHVDRPPRVKCQLACHAGYGADAFQAAQCGLRCHVVDMLLQHRRVVTIRVLDIVRRRRTAALQLLEV
jgi:hypothetical protein